MTAPVVEREHAVLELALIDRPELDARIDRNPEKLEELARDILRRGLIEPLKVVRVGERYEVVDGFRRYLACKSAGVTRAECLIYPSRDVALEGVKYAANAYREDMSAADEAIYFNELLKTECGGDIEKVCALVGKRLSYVDNRLALLNGDELVFEALKQRQIKIGVAHELNKCTDAEYRRYFLKHAVLEESSVVVVSNWILQWETALRDRPGASASSEPTIAPAPAPVHDPFVCVICRKSDPRFIPETLYVHAHCRLAILEPLLQNARGDEEFEHADPNTRRI